MKILIGITTYQREQKLIRLLESIKKNTFKDYRIAINFDNQDDSYYVISRKYPETICTFMEKHYYVEGNWNFIIRNTMSAIGNSSLGNPTHEIKAILPLVDDVELFPDCLDKLVDDMKLLYPDTDGVCGVTQVGKQHSFVPAGQCLIGKRFIERFQKVDYQVYAPCYTHWNIDYELWQYALSLNKFTLSKAKLTHYHPSVYQEEKDETHLITRGKIIREDRKIFEERQKQGLIWGQTFKSVEEYDAKKE